MLKAGTYMNIEAAVLAGGENKRFNGKVKANLEFGDKPIIESIIDILDSIFPSTLIVTNYSSEFNSLAGYTMVEDIYKKAGPLGGIHSALTNSQADALFIVAGDMPLLSESFIRRMTEFYFTADYEVLIPRLGGNIEPLHAIYSRLILGRLNNYLSLPRKKAIRAFLEEVRVGYIDIEDGSLEPSAFTNINTPEDLERARREIENK